MHNSACKSISFLDVIIDNNAYRWFGERYTKMDDGLDIQWEHNIIIITLTFLNLDLFFICTKIRTPLLYRYIHSSYNNKSNAQPSSNQKVME